MDATGSRTAVAPSQSPTRRILRRASAVLIVLSAIPLVAWAAGALYYDLPAPPTLRSTAAILWLTVAILAPILARPRRWAILGAVALFVAIVAWWLSISPRNDRDWQPDVAQLARATFDGDRVTIENVRNCDYRTETDYDPRWETRTYHLADLRGVDAFITTWGSPWMAHPILSFDFGEGGHLCFSIETRKERGESYSAIGGLYRQYELIYIAADERDVIRLRTNFRKGEEVYRYRLLVTPDVARSRLLGYLRRINELAQRPEFYNALTTNCTTSIRMQADPNQRQPFDYRMLLNGTIDELFYERGLIDRSRPFQVTKAEAHINQRANRAGDAPDFSELIRDPEPADH
ncbi:MAG: DUF4105 domain-containing protein [Phycisphaerae bacterium]|nr:DUF4105 domain-containing protein [Phycisphaerae bacterium]